MAGRIRASDIDLVRERVRIDDVIGEQVTLKSAGTGSLKGLCPFHDERTPSFHVTPSKGLYYCFGCEAGGDAIDFLMNHDHLSFTEAVEKLAIKAGVTLRYEGGGPSTEKERGSKRTLLAVNAAARDYYIAQLAGPEGKAALSLLAERGFDGAALEKFQVGYAPRRGLLTHLRDKGFSANDILDSGVAGKGDRGLYDRFRDRIIWPIQDLSGDIVGFGARRMSEEAGPKYLNTPETSAYKKSSVLYGLHAAKKAIATSQQVVVVEGYTDVMACHLAGIENAVATCGTAFGSGHVQVLRRILMDDARAQVIFTFDGDAAGQKAALRAYDEDQSIAARTFVAVARDGLDPCDLRMQHGDQAIRDLVDSRQPLFEFVLRARIADLALGTAEGRVAATRAVAPVIAGIKDLALQPEYAREVSGWLGVGPNQVMAAVRQSQGGTTPQSPVANRTGRAAPGPTLQPQSPTGAGDALLEKASLRVILQVPELLTEWLPAVTTDCFTVPRAVEIHDAIMAIDNVEPTDRAWLGKVLEACPDDSIRSAVRALVAEPLPTQTVTSAYAVGVVARLLDRKAERDTAHLRAELGIPELRDEPGREEQLLGDLLEVEEYRRSLREYWAGDF